jgi:hypothetical protein
MRGKVDWGGVVRIVVVVATAAGGVIEIIHKDKKK